MMPPTTTGALSTLDAVQTGNRPAGDSPRPFSRRERQIVSLLATGCSNREIADRLGLRLQTVKNHLSRVYRKQGVPNRVQLAVMVVRSVDGIVPDAAPDPAQSS